MTEKGTNIRVDLDAKRKQTVDALSEHFANDFLKMEEFERRVDVALRAGTQEELQELHQALPSGDLPNRAADASKHPMAPAAIELIKNRIAEPDAPHVHRILKHNLAVRQSS